MWTGAANPTDWSSLLKPVKTDAYGAVFEVPLNDGATSLSYIIHKGDEKDLSADQSLDLKAGGYEVWLLNGQEKYLLPQPAGSAAALDLTTSKAVWIDKNTVAFNGSDAAASTQLLYSHDGSIAVKDGALTSDDERWLRLSKTTLTDAQKAKFPYLKDYTAWSVDPRDGDRVREALDGRSSPRSGPRTEPCWRRPASRSPAYSTTSTQAPPRPSWGRRSTTAVPRLPFGRPPRSR